MDYVSTATKAKEWGISQRRVAIYCKEGRISGAELFSNRWMIPTNAEKPDDPRSKHKEDEKDFSKL